MRKEFKKGRHYAYADILWLWHTLYLFRYQQRKTCAEASRVGATELLKPSGFLHFPQKISWEIYGKILGRVLRKRIESQTRRRDFPLLSKNNRKNDIPFFAISWVEDWCCSFYGTSESAKLPSCQRLERSAWPPAFMGILRARVTSPNATPHSKQGLILCWGSGIGGVGPLDSHDEYLNFCSFLWAYFVVILHRPWGKPPTECTVYQSAVIYLRSFQWSFGVPLFGIAFRWIGAKQDANKGGDGSHFEMRLVLETKGWEVKL